LTFRVLINIFTRPILAILLTHSSPSKACLGTINGANQALAALCRAAGPTVGGIVLSHSLEVGKPWIVWFGLSALSLLVFTGAWFLRDEEDEYSYAPIAQEDRLEEGEDDEDVHIDEDRRRE
jgi:predicted MFS family arabinose efflux permease